MNFFSNVIPVRGFNRSIIYDLHRGNFELIPNDLYKSIKLANSSFKIATKNKEYLEFLKKKEFVFEIKPNEEVYFPTLKLGWDHPSIITNVLVHADVLDVSIFKLLAELNVKVMGIIISSSESISKINDLLNTEILKQYSLQSFNLILLKQNIENIDAIKNNPFVTSITYLNEKSEKDILKDSRIVLNRPSIKLYTEAQKHHAYFNRKLYIDEKGNIKNAPSTEKTFGNLKTIKSGLQIKEIVQSKQFQKYWFVNKETCDICKDCEFRFMCVDNRVPVKRDHSWYHENECNYNPYISKWEKENGYLTLAECGVISSKDGFTINKPKINQINKKLWGY